MFSRTPLRPKRRARHGFTSQYGTRMPATGPFEIADEGDQPTGLPEACRFFVVMPGLSQHAGGPCLPIGHEEIPSWEKARIRGTGHRERECRVVVEGGRPDWPPQSWCRGRAVVVALEVVPSPTRRATTHVYARLTGMATPCRSTCRGMIVLRLRSRVSPISKRVGRTSAPRSACGAGRCAAGGCLNHGEMHSMG